jgi:hypothetical protein
VASGARSSRRKLSPTDCALDGVRNFELLRRFATMW